MKRTAIVLSFLLVPGLISAADSFSRQFGASPGAAPPMGRFLTAQLVSGQGAFVDDTTSVAAVGDFNGDGKADVVTGDGHSDVYVLLGNGDGTFQKSATLSLGSFVETLSFAIGDFNGDTKMDLAVATGNVQFNTGAVQIFLGNGNGTFTTGQAVAIGTIFSNQPQGMAVGDFNADQKLDLVAVNGGASTVSVVLGNGDGTFQAAKNFAVGQQDPRGVAVADLNGDGKLDVVVANHNGALNNTVSVLLGNGDGTLQAAHDFTADAGPMSVVLADFNGDGKLDIATANRDTSDVSILLGNGDGTFQATTNIGVGLLPITIAVADFNQDGKLDLITGNSANSNVAVLLGKGDSTFQPPVFYGADTSPSSLALGDFNGDGNTDWILGNSVDPVFTMAFGNGNGTFQAATQYTNASWAATLADFNKDGKMDMAIATNSGVSVFLGNGNGTFQSPTSITGVGTPLHVAAADFNKDGNMDLAVANGGPNQVFILLGNGNGTFQAPVTYTLGGSTAYEIVIADFNKDGKLDLSVAAASNNTVNILLGNGDGTFQAARTFVFGASSGYMAAGDFNQDGKLDVAIADPQANGVALMLGDGAGGLGSPTLVPAGRLTTGVTAGDFNHDGKLDMAVTNQADNNVTVLLGNGDGSFTFSANYPIIPPGVGGQATPIYVAAADFTGDGNLDLVVANANNRVGGFGVPNLNLGMRFLQGNSDGTFQAAQGFIAGLASNTLAIADLNRDGASDVVVSENNGIEALLTVLLNTGGTFVKLTSSVNPSDFGQPVKFTATVNASVGGSPSPTGSVIFKDGTTVLGTVPLTSGSAALTTSTLAAGTHSITASYSGDSNFNRHTAGPLSQVVSAVSLKPLKLNFGNQKVGTTSRPKKTTLTNNGSAAITISSIALGGPNPGDFTEVSNCPISPNTLGAGISCSIKVTFKPAATGSRKAMVEVTDDAGGSPQKVALTGNGT